MEIGSHKRPREANNDPSQPPKRPATDVSAILRGDSNVPVIDLTTSVPANASAVDEVALGGQSSASQHSPRISLSAAPVRTSSADGKGTEQGFAQQNSREEIRSVHAQTNISLSAPCPPSSAF